MMSRRGTSLSITIIITLTGVACALTPTAGTFYRTLFVLPLLLLLPGYALMSFLFPKRSLSSVDQIAFSLGLSLAVTVLSGLVLNLTSWGMQAKSWALLLGALTICLAIAAQIRRRSPIPTPSTRFTLNSRLGLLFGIAVILLVAAVSVASLGAIRQWTPGFTQLWILPIDDTASDKVILGLHNYEGTTVSYQLKLRAGDTLLIEFSTIEIESGGKWETVVNVPPEYEGVQALKAELYRLDDPETIYRRVTLWRNE